MKARTKLLVVEDSATQAEELVFLLEEEGFDVETARDGLSGLAKCASSSFDIVLSDVMMPGLDGYELCKKLKSDPATSQIPVILLTTLSEPMDIVRGLECGADNFITKPYDKDYLIGRLQRFWKNRICTRGQIFPGPFHYAIKTFHSTRIGPGDDQKILVAARCRRRFDSHDHDLKIDNCFACEVSAAFRKFLVFNVTTREPGFFQFANRLCNFVAFAKAGVGIDDCGNSHRVRDVTGESRDFVPI